MKIAIINEEYNRLKFLFSLEPSIDFEFQNIYEHFYDYLLFLLDV